MKYLANVDQESFWVIGYTVGGVEIYRNCLFLGGTSGSKVDTKILFKRLIMHDCASFIIIHNHPGGSINLSDDDKRCTKTIELIAKLFEMNFLDHIIIGQNSFFSFSDEGLL